MGLLCQLASTLVRVGGRLGLKRRAKDVSAQSRSRSIVVRSGSLPGRRRGYRSIGRPPAARLRGA
jgi:hypothetical protein